MECSADVVAAMVGGADPSSSTPPTVRDHETPDGHGSSTGPTFAADMAGTGAGQYDVLMLLSSSDELDDAETIPLPESTPSSSPAPPMHIAAEAADNKQEARRHALIDMRPFADHREGVMARIPSTPRGSPLQPLQMPLSLPRATSSTDRGHLGRRARSLSPAQTHPIGLKQRAGRESSLPTLTSVPPVNEGLRTDVGPSRVHNVLPRDLHTPAEDRPRNDTLADIPHETGTDFDRAAALLAAMPPSPPRRNLRTRKAAQLAPYTTEMQRYQRRLIRNDWQDAVVISRQLARAERDRHREAGEPSETSRRPGRNLSTSPSLVKRSSEGVHQAKQRRKGRNPERERQESTSKPAGVQSPPQVNDEGALPPSRHGTASAASSSRSLSDGPERRRKRHRIIRDETSEESVTGSESDRHRRSPWAAPSEDERTTTNSSGVESDFVVEDIAEAPAQRAARHDRSSSGPRDYDQLLRVLKRTMPARMARAYIDDLKAMDRETSDVQQNHQSSQSSNSSEAETVSDDVRPGESRKRAPRSGRAALVDLNLAGDTEDETAPSRKGSDADDDMLLGDGSPTATRGAISISESEDENDASRPNIETWWAPSVQRQAGSVPQAREADAIDRMLTKGAVSRRSAKQRRVFESTKPSKHAYRPMDQAQKHRRQVTSRRSGGSDKYRRVGKPRMKGSTGRTFLASGGSKSLSYLPGNPRLAFPRERAYPRERSCVNFLRDDILFADGDRISKDLYPDEGSRSFSPSKTNYLSSTSHVLREINTASFNQQQSENQQQGNIVQSPPSIDHVQARAAGLKRQLPGALRSAQSSTTAQNLAESFIQHKSHSTASPLGHLDAQLDEAAAWSGVRNIRVDFGIRQPILGVQLDKANKLGQGRLYELLNSPTDKEASLYPATVFGIDLQLATFSAEVSEQVCEAFVASTLTGSSDTLDARSHLEESDAECILHFRKAFGEWTHFLCRWVSNANVRATTLANIVRHSTTCIDSCFKKLGRQHHMMTLDMKWTKLELAWRMKHKIIRSAECNANFLSPDTLSDMSLGDEDDLILSGAEDLMVALLVHGLHRTLLQVKACSASRPGMDGAMSVISDPTVSLWISLIHLLTNSEMVRNRDFSISFWTIFESALQRYHLSLRKTKSALVVAENTWYSVFAICALSHFSSTTGSANSKSVILTPHWSLVASAISAVRLRFDDVVECKLSSPALRHRDAYIQIILQRILILLQSWRWNAEGIEAVLGKIFQLFDAHRLEDLPTEDDHDFPSFLRHYDEGLLREESGSKARGNAFQTFLSILALSVEGVREMAGSDIRHKERATARLLSRFSPVRSMNFTTDNVPTSHERSALYNHYSIALLYLHLVPATHAQRLLQIQQYLRISSADAKSQFIGIRAMMYAATILRHHNLCLDQVIQWFRSVFERQKQRLDDLLRSEPQIGKQLERTRKITNETFLLKMALRAIQYVVRFGSLQRDNRGHQFPDTSLLDPVWTVSILDSQLSVQSPSLTFEVLQIIRNVVLQRNAVLDAADKETRATTSKNDDSQDSYADLLEDFDFDDADLLGAAGYEQPSAHEQDCQDKARAEREKRQVAKEETKHKDANLAEMLHARISPALFRLMNSLFHPDRAHEYTLALKSTPANRDALWDANGSRSHDLLQHHFDQLIEQSHRTSLAQVVVDCWSICAWILAEEHHKRSWSVYFNYGFEDLRRIVHDTARREATLRFLTIVLGMAAARSSFSSHMSIYHDHLGEVWGGFLVSMMAPTFSLQHLLLDHVYRLERHHCSYIHRIHLSREGAADEVINLVSGVSLGSWPSDMDPPQPSDVFTHREELITSIMGNLSSKTRGDRSLLSPSFVALTAMFSALRAHVQEVRRTSTTAKAVGGVPGQQIHLEAYAHPPSNDIDRSGAPPAPSVLQRDEYIAFARRILDACRLRLSEELQRGLSIELRRTADLLGS